MVIGYWLLVIRCSLSVICSPTDFTGQAFDMGHLIGSADYSSAAATAAPTASPYSGSSGIWIFSSFN